MAVKMNKGTAPAAAAKSGSQTPEWAKRGKAAQEDMKKYDEEADKHYAALNRMWRYWLKKGESGAVTFVDGDLLDDGTLDLLTFREHTVEVNGEWQNFVCIAESEPCPICEMGNFPALVGVLTVIDHRSYKGKKGVYRDTPKLYVAKKGTIKLLQQMATKRGGLAGARVEISRLGEQDPNVGGSFDFEDKKSIAELQKTYTRKGKDGKTSSVFVPADYAKEIVHMTGAELRAEGFGAGKVIGGEASDATPAGKGAGDHM